MYGWVNASVESLVVTTYGESVWIDILKRANVEVGESGWGKYDSYPDSITYDIIGSATVVLGMEAAKILEVFGAYFFQFAKQEGYANLLRCLGNDLQSWLSNVNTLHMHLHRAFPEMVAPQFW